MLFLNSIVLEEKKSQSEEKLEVIDESNLIRRGYPKKNRSRMWDIKGALVIYDIGN